MQILMLRSLNQSQHFFASSKISITTNQLGYLCYTLILLLIKLVSYGNIKLCRYIYYYIGLDESVGFINVNLV